MGAYLENSSLSGTVKIKKFLGEIKLEVHIHGPACNPFESPADLDEESENYYRDMIFQANRDNLSYIWQNDVNCITILVHETGSRNALLTLSAMILAIILGYVIKFFPPSVLDFINNNILSTIQGIFMNVLSIMIAPVIFFSNIVPNNLISPILQGNMIQIIFSACLIGFAMSSLGKRVNGLFKFFDEANILFQKLVSMIVSFMPVIAFTSMFMLVAGSPSSTLLVLLLLLLSIVAGGVIMYFFYGFCISLVGHISPMGYLRKCLKVLINPFMIPSSSACIPISMNFSREKLGTSEKVTSFVVPLGATIDMAGSCICTALVILFLVAAYGITLNPADYVRMGLMVFIMAIGIPGIPNGAFVGITSIAVALGLPVDSIGIVLGVWQIIDRLATVINVNGDIATAVAVSASEKNWIRIYTNLSLLNQLGKYAIFHF